MAKLIGIARAGNVVGGGDWSENRLIPDCIRSWSKNKKVLIRNFRSTRPWQHVIEAISGYLFLAASLKKIKKFMVRLLISDQVIIKIIM